MLYSFSEADTVRDLQTRISVATGVSLNQFVLVF